MRLLANGRNNWLTSSVFVSVNNGAKKISQFVHSFRVGWSLMMVFHSFELIRLNGILQLPIVITESILDFERIRIKVPASTRYSKVYVFYFLVNRSSSD